LESGVKLLNDFRSDSGGIDPTLSTYEDIVGIDSKLEGLARKMDDVFTPPERNIQQVKRKIERIKSRIDKEKP